jgi:hypothetical protein
VPSLPSKSETPEFKPQHDQKKQKTLAQVVQGLPTKHKALSLTPVSPKKKKKKKKKKQKTKLEYKEEKLYFKKRKYYIPLDMI